VKNQNYLKNILIDYEKEEDLPLPEVDFLNIKIYYSVFRTL